MGHIPDYIYRKWHRIFHEYRKTVNCLSNCKLITLLVRASTIISRNCHGILPGILRHHLLHGDCKSIVRYRAQSFKNLPPPDASRSNSLISFLCPPLPLLSTWSFYLPVSPPKVKTCVISHSLPSPPFFFHLPPLSPFSSNLLLPSFFSPRSRGRSADQVPFEPKKIPSIYPPPLLPSLILLSNAEDRYVPQGFGANLPTPGREIPGKKAAAGVARHGKRKVAVAATPDGLIPLPGSPFFFSIDGRKELVTVHVCAGQGWLGDS